MNQERFDDLTRTLATAQFSRLQVLKTLLGSAFLGLFWPWSGEREASAQVAPGACTYAPGDPNRVIGDCQCYEHSFVCFPDYHPRTATWGPSCTRETPHETPEGNLVVGVAGTFAGHIGERKWEKVSQRVLPKKPKDTLICVVNHYEVSYPHKSYQIATLS
jgi:hypothetical protein